MTTKAAADADIRNEIERRVADRKRQREAEERAQIEAEVLAEANREEQLQSAKAQLESTAARRDAAQLELDELAAKVARLKAQFETGWQALSAKQLEITSLNGSYAAAEVTVRRLTPDPIRDLSQGRAPFSQLIDAIDNLKFTDGAAEGIEWRGRRLALSERELVRAIDRAIGRLKGEELDEVQEHIFRIGLGSRMRDAR